jgi:hypothetical protein
LEEVFDRISHQIQDLIGQKKVAFINFDLKTPINFFIPFDSRKSPPFLYYWNFWNKDH